MHGNMFGLLAAHPVTPLLSLHHMDHMDPIFPNMTRPKALGRLFDAANVDSQRMLQQTVCYDRWFSWTISVSWGYAVQVFPDHMFLPDALNVQQTFRQWKKGNAFASAFTFNKKDPHPDPCKRPTIFYLDSLSSSGQDMITSNYTKHYQNCSYDSASPRKLKSVKVFSNKLDLSIKQVQYVTLVVQSGVIRGMT